MRQRIILAIAIVACVLCGVLAYKAYQQDHSAAVQYAKKRAAAQAEATQLEQQRQAQINAQLQHLKDVCIAQAQAAKKPVDQCNLQLVQ